jgi:hypothetical protein
VAPSKSKFAGMFDAAPDTAEPELEANGRTELPTVSRPAPPARVGRPPGKRSNPAFKQFSVLLRRDTQRAATAILRDKDNGQDLSGLVQTLLEGWINRQKS